MGQLSYYADNLIINALLRATDLTAPVTVYLALYTTNPTASDTGAEVAGGSYARQAVTFGAPTNGSASNSADITFPVASGSWGTITHAGIRDNISSGHLLFYGPLTSPKVIGAGDIFKFNTGSVICQIS